MNALAALSVNVVRFLWQSGADSAFARAPELGIESAGGRQPFALDVVLVGLKSAAFHFLPPSGLRLVSTGPKQTSIALVGLIEVKALKIASAVSHSRAVAPSPTVRANASTWTLLSGCSSIVIASVIILLVSPCFARQGHFMNPDALLKKPDNIHAAR
jgi:hypothetical protein